MSFTRIILSLAVSFLVSALATAQVVPVSKHASDAATSTAIQALWKQPPHPTLGYGWSNQAWDDAPAWDLYSVSDVSTAGASWNVSRISVWFRNDTLTWMTAPPTTGRLSVFPKIAGQLPITGVDTPGEHVVPIAVDFSGNLIEVSADTSGIAELQGIVGDFWIGLTPVTSFNSGHDFELAALTSSGYFTSSSIASIDIDNGNSWFGSDSHPELDGLDLAISLEGEGQPFPFWGNGAIQAWNWIDLGVGPVQGDADQIAFADHGSTVFFPGILTLGVNSTLPNKPLILLVGLGLLGAPFKGGVIVATPDIVLSGFGTDGSGHAALFSIPFPNILVLGINALFFQIVAANASAPHGLTLSKGLSLAFDPYAGVCSPGLGCGQSTQNDPCSIAHGGNPNFVCATIQQDAVTTTTSCVNQASLTCTSVLSCNTSMDCPPGWGCALNSCCGVFGICAPLVPLDAASFSATSDSGPLRPVLSGHLSLTRGSARFELIDDGSSVDNPLVIIGGDAQWTRVGNGWLVPRPDVLLAAQPSGRGVWSLEADVPAVPALIGRPVFAQAAYVQAGDASGYRVSGHISGTIGSSAGPENELTTGVLPARSDVDFHGGKYGRALAGLTGPFLGREDARKNVIVFADPLDGYSREVLRNLHEMTNGGVDIKVVVIDTPSKEVDAEWQARLSLAAWDLDPVAWKAMRALWMAKCPINRSELRDHAAAAGFDVAALEIAARAPEYMIRITAHRALAASARMIRPPMVVIGDHVLLGMVSRETLELLVEGD